MTITEEMRLTNAYQYFKENFNEGYFIERSVNSNKYVKDVILFEIVKQETYSTRSCSCYVAFDVAKALSKEFNVPIQQRAKETIWLNDNPENYKPSRGQKITFHE